MLNNSRKTIAVALVSAAALTASTFPASARSAAYCRDLVQSERSHDGFNPAILLPLAVVGAGAGAVVGLAVGGLSVATGAAVGAGSGAGFGLLHGKAHHGDRYYKNSQAYKDCRAE
jgi:Na+/H+ antiporter NhaC